jgi:AAA+ ATPase superfamily predicted ATPase
MVIVGRKSEISELERCEKSGKSELICVYGRRRVGKTYLVEQTFSSYFAFRATGLESGNTRDQLKSFFQRLKEYGDDEKTIPKNWFEAFSRLEKILKKDDVRQSPHGKKIVFLDEFPWFVTPRSDFLMAFGEFWNRSGTVGRDYMFIICGSATSWIINNVIENSGSLYDRVTCQLFIKPFSLKETETLFRDQGFGWSRKQIVDCQMVFGGLPYFFNLMNPNESLTWNINKLCLEEHALLRNESKKLLEATLKESPVYNRIMEYLSRFQYGALKAECCKTLELPAGSFSRAVEDLVKCGYVHEYRDQYTSGHPIKLQLVDPFLLFHYKFLSGDNADRYRDFSDYRNDTGRYMNWRGHAFEILCMYHIEGIKKALGISGVRTTEYQWNGREAQVDLVIDRDDGITNLCESKYTDTPFSISREYEIELLNKAEAFKKETGSANAVKLVLISVSGISGTAHTDHISKVLTLDDLFE